MNPRLVNVILTALCLGLLGTIGYMAYLMKMSPELTPYGSKGMLVTNTVTQIAVRKVYPTNFLASLGKLPVNWRMIESTNYQVYIANLRAIDCPEETIRDIVVTDIAKVYARRRAAIRAQAPPPKFWETGDAWENGPMKDPAIRNQLQALDTEQRELVRALLGVNLQTEMSKLWNGEDDAEQMYGFLPQEKRQRVLDVQSKYDELEQEIYANSKGMLLDEDQEKIKRIEKQKEAELAGVLSPEELEEFDLRHSSTANAMRAQMSGFQPTEEEFRKIFRLQKVFDNDFNQVFDATDDKQSEVKSSAQQAAQDALNAEVKKAIGDTRYNEWARAQDPDYKALAQMSDRFEVPKDTIAKVYDMKQEAERQKQKLDANPNFTPEQRNAALAAIARETQKSVAGALGDQVFRAYQKANGQWMQDLAVSLAPPPPPQPIVIQQVPPGFLPPPLPHGLPGNVPGAITPRRPIQQ